MSACRRARGQLLGDLLRNGEIGYELSLDPRTPIVIGVYPIARSPAAEPVRCEDAPVCLR